MPTRSPGCDAPRLQRRGHPQRGVAELAEAEDGVVHPQGGALGIPRGGVDQVLRQVAHGVWFLPLEVRPARTRPVSDLSHMSDSVRPTGRMREGAPWQTARSWTCSGSTAGSPIVTGASSGLGAVFARTLAEAGADVALGARRVDRLAETQQAVEAAGRRAIAVAHRRLAGRRTARPSSTPRWRSSGRSTSWSTTPASAPPYPATRETPEQFRQVIDVNLNGCYWMAQACGRVMQPGSSIVNISSILGLTTAGLPQAAYAASKAGLIGLTRDLAQQWTGRRGIRVNALAPGLLRVGDDRQLPARLPGLADAAGARWRGPVSRRSWPRR